VLRGCVKIKKPGFDKHFSVFYKFEKKKIPSPPPPLNKNNKTKPSGYLAGF